MKINYVDLLDANVKWYLSKYHDVCEEKEIVKVCTQQLYDAKRKVRLCSHKKSFVTQTVFCFLFRRGEDK